MDLETCLSQLERNTGVFPAQAFAYAVTHREELTPHLLHALEDATWNVDAYAHHVDFFAPLYAMYLLAEFREPQACELIVALCRQAPEAVDALLGDTLTEDLPAILASVCAGRLAPLQALIEDAAACEEARTAAVAALVVAVCARVVPRAAVMAYFGELFRGRLLRTPHPVWDALVRAACALHPAELLPELQRAYADRLVDAEWLGLDEVQRIGARDPEAVFQQTRQTAPPLIASAAEAMSGWDCFQAHAPTKAEDAP